MRDEEKTKEQLLQELTEARNRNAELEKASLSIVGNDLYRTLFESAPVGIALANSTGQLLNMNPALEVLLGYPFEELNQAAPLMLGNHSLEEILSSYPTKESKHEIMLEGDPPRYFEITARPIQGGTSLEYWVLAFRDITMERALQESEEKYRQLFSNELEAISIFNPEDGKILDVNQAYLNLYGYSNEEILEMTVANVSAEPDETMKAIQNAIPTRSARILVRWYKKKDGTVFPVEIYAATFKWKGQEVMCATIRDITERMEAEQRRTELVIERERVKILSNFITQASHEFRTPFATINTCAYLLRKTTDPIKRENYTRQIEFQIQDTTALINSLTTMARLDSGEQLVHDVIDANELIQWVNESLLPMVLEGKLDLVLDLSEEPLLVRGDSTYLDVAIEHILQNAIRYTPSGGAITVRTSLASDNAVIEIADTGIGISDDTQLRIFERFYRADIAGTTRGFGLGLPIAKAIIEEHEGKIEVASELGKGSKFTILLPLTQSSLSGSVINRGFR